MTNVKAKMSNQVQNLNNKKYDLQERIAKFGEYIIDLLQNNL